MLHKIETTFGYELELGDIPRGVEIPPHLGTWEQAETDIVNIHFPFIGRACDPLGLSPPVGGEINVMPAHSPLELTNRVFEIINYFKRIGYNPSASCVNHGHVHVRVIGLRDRIDWLKALTLWIKENQKDVVKKLYGYKEDPRMKETKTARTYLKWDGGRMMPDWMADNIIKKAKTFEDFIRLQCCGKDGVSRGRPFRYAINTYCLKHTDTIELRCLRASLSRTEVYDSIRFLGDMVLAALVTGETAKELFAKNNYEFPKFEYNHEHYVGWEKTKWDKERGKKVRTLHEI